MNNREGINNLKESEEIHKKAKTSNHVLNSTSNNKLVKTNKFPIIGIGASAGGLDALKKLFSNIPPNSGMAYVVIQHMDPHYKSNLAPILSGYTVMKSVQIRDGMKIESEHVYVIPPDYDLNILNGKLYLLKSEKPHGVRNPIDYFFKNLAEDQGDNAVCIILSGFGSDGTEGLKAIKAEGGLAIVQDPNTAGSDNMPRSAIKTGLVDFVLSPEQIPEKLISYTNTSVSTKKRINSLDQKASEDLKKVLGLIRSKTGYNLSLYKENTINRRIGRRMNLHQIQDISNYIRYLRSNPKEIDLLFNDILINVTEFFRDPQAYVSLKDKITDYIKNRPPGETIRVWVPGCSTGEEAYSIAMILRECIDEQGTDLDIQIFGTDLDSNAIKIARDGVYSETIVNNVSEERLNKFFWKKEDKYIIKKNIRDTVIFALHDTLKDPPFAYLDIISCRNLLIYFKDEAQKKLLSLFEYSLNKNGILFLGSSESIGDFLNVFIPLDKKWKIFKSIKTSKHNPQLFKSHNYFGLNNTFKENLENIPEMNRYNITNTAKNHLLESFVPPSVLIDKSGEILYVHGRIGKYLELASGKTTVNIFDMAREDINFELNTAVRRAISTKKDVLIEHLMIRNNGNLTYINLNVKPIVEDDETLLIVSFERVAKPGNIRSEIKLKPTVERENHIIKLEKELKDAKQQLKEKISEMNASYEELKATKGELQSVNEEMVTVNAELQITIDNLTHTNDDLHNLMNSTHMAILFLDNQFKVKKFTKETKKLINLIDSDIGRPINHIVSNIKYDNFEKDLLEVKKTNVPKQSEVQTKDNNWYLMRIMPYETLENVINGLVITFSDINQQKKAQRLVQDALNYANSIINTIREPLVVLNSDLKIISANKSFYTTFKLNKKDTVGTKLYDLSNKLWDIPKLRELLEKILKENTFLEDFELENDFPDIGHVKMLINARRVYREDFEQDLILMSMEMLTIKIR